MRGILQEIKRLELKIADKADNHRHEKSEENWLEGSVGEYWFFGYYHWIWDADMAGYDKDDLVPRSNFNSLAGWSGALYKNQKDVKAGVHPIKQWHGVEKTLQEAKTKVEHLFDKLKKSNKDS